MKKLKFPSILTGLAILLGLVLTLLSFSEICTSSCSAGHAFKLLGMPFGWVGIAYFIILLSSYALSYRNSIMTLVTGLLLAGGIGAELIFILVQKYSIGSWCPICLGIAVSIVIAALGWSFEYFYTFPNIIRQAPRDEIMHQFKKGMGSITAFALGLLIAIAGITRQEDLRSAESSFEEKLVFGKKESSTDVYIFTSWSCPACHRFEPTLERIIPQILPKARVIFVDYGVDDVTLNYLPYNLSFMLHNKDHYLELRGMLKDLLATTASPKEEEVEQKAKELGVKYEQLDFSSVAMAIEYSQKLAELFKVTHLPSFVIVNPKTDEHEILTGIQITPANVLNSIQKVDRMMNM